MTTSEPEGQPSAVGRSPHHRGEIHVSLDLADVADISEIVSEIVDPETGKAIGRDKVTAFGSSVARGSLMAAEPQQQEETEPGRVKLTVNLPEREMATLRRIAAKRDISLTDAVRRAIAMEEFVDQVEADHGHLLVELPDRTIRQLVVR